MNKDLSVIKSGMVLNYRRVKDGEKGFPYVDDPANKPMFEKMEELGILAASLHIADPVEYWREITSLSNVLAKHPNLKVVAAHASWLICQDAQIDYLIFLLDTYPNFNMVSYDNLRDFI